MASHPRADMDEQSEAETHNTKISDFGYSTGCSNSQSQRSGSSKSIHSNSGSSNSSGYGRLANATEEFPQPRSYKSAKDSHKKRKGKSSGGEGRGGEGKAEKQEGGEGKEETNQERVHSPPEGNNAGGGGNEGEVLSISVTQALNVLRSLQSTAEETDTEVIPEMDPPAAMDTRSLLDTPQDTGGEEFQVVVSMHDGKVSCTSASLIQVLGFPKDMWVGRSFIDLLHPKDRVGFAAHIATGLANPNYKPHPSLNTHSDTPFTSNKFFCSLRKYRGLKTAGFSVKGKSVQYLPCQLSLKFRDVEGSMMLAINAKPFKTAYKQPEETQQAPTFVTRHRADCLLSHADAEAVSYLGYLPQDMLGRSVFEFYHPEDLPLVREIYTSVLASEGSPYRSIPYRFRSQNGGYVLLETEWSSYVNPWSKRLEFVMGQHKVLKGPPDPDVFAAPTESYTITEEVLNESLRIQEDIKRVLNEPVLKSELAKQQVSKRCKDLACFMESLMQEIAVPDEQPPEHSFSERDSVMLGEISPHHEYYDSKSSSGTPPSYNQLNYKENIDRFLSSNPKTDRSDESCEGKVGGAGKEGKDTPPEAPSPEDRMSGPEPLGERSRRSAPNGSGTGSGSGSGLSSKSQLNESNSNANSVLNNSYVMLTEAVLCRHNNEMEKLMVKKHKELRSKHNKIEENKLLTAIEKLQEHCHGVKRSGSLSWEDKVTKHRLTEAPPSRDTPRRGMPRGVPATPTNPMYQHGPSNVNLWPPFSVNAYNGSAPPQATYTTGSTSMPLGVIPVYYIPGNPSHLHLPPNSMGLGPMGARDVATPPATSQVASYLPNGGPLQGINRGASSGALGSGELPGTSSLVSGGSYLSQVPLMNALPLYPTMGYGPPSFVYSPLMMAPQAPPPAGPPPSPPRPLPSDKGSREGEKFQRPASQATSVKAEPGSALGSMALSECSKKDVTLGDDFPADDSGGQSQDEDKKNSGSSHCDTGTGTGDESMFSLLRQTDDSMKSGECSPEGGASGGEWGEKWEERERPVLKEPPWLEQVSLTHDLVYRYQISDKSLSKVLQADLNRLNVLNQPHQVDDQLQQLYVDLELNGLSTRLRLEEGFTSSSSSGEERTSSTSSNTLRHKKPQSRRCYNQLAMIYEENMPMPSPVN